MWDHKGLKDLLEPMVLTVSMAHKGRKVKKEIKATRVT
jgi:hypothetical protein